jgi:hypothetical protein
MFVTVFPYARTVHTRLICDNEKFIRNILIRSSKEPRSATQRAKPMFQHFDQAR